MKKVIALVGALLLLSGCTQKPEHTTYITSGRYYISGEVITQDGNIWSYTQDIISKQPSYDHEPILALFDDNGTPENIYDDEILGAVLDRETKIYDELETALSDSFTIERKGNKIKLSIK